MNILILGGTRFLGRYIAKAAIEKGHDVTLLIVETTLMFSPK